jgi:hypothetical protein
MTGRKEKTASMQKLIDRYEKVLNEQQDAGKSKREQINAFLRGGAGQSSMGMALAGGSSSLAQTRENQEAQVRTGVRELIKANQDLAVFDSEMAKTTLENGMTYFQQSKNDSREAADIASRMTNQQIQSANQQALQEFNAKSDNEKRRVEVEIENKRQRMRRDELAYSQSSQDEAARLQLFDSNANIVKDIRLMRVAAVDEKNKLSIQYQEVGQRIKGLMAEIQKGGTDKKLARFNEDLVKAQADMENISEVHKIQVLMLFKNNGLLQLENEAERNTQGLLGDGESETSMDAKSTNPNIARGLSDDSNFYLTQAKRYPNEAR